MPRTSDSPVVKLLKYIDELSDAEVATALDLLKYRVSKAAPKPATTRKRKPRTLPGTAPAATEG